MKIALAGPKPEIDQVSLDRLEDEIRNDEMRPSPISGPDRDDGQELADWKKKKQRALGVIDPD